MCIKIINFDDVTDVAMRVRKTDAIVVTWEARAKNLLKAELKRRGLSYADLVHRLTEIGVTVTERNLTNKISRGGFSAAFLLQCLIASGAREVLLDYRDSADNSLNGRNFEVTRDESEERGAPPTRRSGRFR